MTREEAIQVLKEYRTIVMNCLGAETPAFDMAIEALSADAVEVVRCGECKHMMADGRCMEFADDGIRPSATDFCSYGDRREDGEADETD